MNLNKTATMKSGGDIMNQNVIKKLGWVATFTAVAMYVSYFPQIYNNLHGDKGDFIQPLVALLNSLLWTIYALGQKKKDWPIAIANIPGIFFAGAAFLTAIM